MQDSPLNPRRAKERIKLLWDSGMSKPSEHFEQELVNDQLDALDVEYLIRTGAVTLDSRSARRWRYRVEGALLDGRRAACIVEINGVIVLVTAFLVKARWHGR